MDWITQPWPWYVAGPLIGMIMIISVLVGKKLGMSSNLKTICSICGAGKVASFFNYNWRSEKWNLIVILGVILGGFIGSHFLSTHTTVDVNKEVISNLEIYGLTNAGKTYLPVELFGTEALSNPKTLLLLILGGFLVGFGARYAGGCTSGHAISGLPNLQLPSLIAVSGFFIGGLLMVHFIFPLIF